MNTMKMLGICALVSGGLGLAAVSAAPFHDEGALLLAGNFLGKPTSFGHKVPDTRRSRGEFAAFEERSLKMKDGERDHKSDKRKRYSPPTKR